MSVSLQAASSAVRKPNNASAQRTPINLTTDPYQKPPHIPTPPHNHLKARLKEIEKPKRPAVQPVRKIAGHISFFTYAITIL